jgi:hypothetical protein
MYRNHSRTNHLSARVATKGIIGVTRCSIGIHSGAVFTRSLLDVVHRSVKKGFGGVSIYAVARQSDEETLELIGTLGQQSDAFALLGKKHCASEGRAARASLLRYIGIALVSDLDADVRSIYRLSHFF